MTGGASATAAPGPTPSSRAQGDDVETIAVEHRPEWDPVRCVLVCHSCGYPGCLYYLAAADVITARGLDPADPTRVPGRRTEVTGHPPRSAPGRR